MKTKRLRNWLIGTMIMITLSIGVVSNFNGFVEAKTSCANNNGTIIKEDVGLFNFNLSCKK